MEGFDGIGNEYSLKLIDTDLPRTFPSLQLFNEDGPYYNQLRTVLETFACFRPDLGYIQGMSYLAAMLCLYFQTFSAKPDENTYMAFQCLANLMVCTLLPAKFSFELASAHTYQSFACLHHLYTSFRFHTTYLCSISWMPMLSRHITTYSRRCKWSMLLYYTHISQAWA